MKIIDVPAHEHSTVAGEPVAASDIPVPSRFNQGTVPLVVDHDEQAMGDLERISEAHGRSYLVKTTPEAEQIDPLLLDEFGNPHTALTTKGNNLTQPGFIRSPTAPSGFLPYGLQEGDALLRVVRASRIMREAGIDTERIVGVFEPEFLVYEEEEVSVPEYKKRLIEGMLSKARDGTEQVEKHYPFSYKEISDAAVALKALDFFVTLRSTSAALRIGDLLKGGRMFAGIPVDVGIDYDNLSATFESYNAMSSHRKAELARLGLGDRLPVELNDETDGDVLEHYFSEVLPRSMALNLSRLHDLGLMHAFPHMNNFTTLGGLVDLDSVKGERLDLDDSINNAAGAIMDNAQVAASAFEKIGFFSGHGLDWQRLAHHSRDSFIRSYFDLREDTLQPADRAKHIFVTSYHPSFLHRDIHSSLDIEAAKSFYPNIEAALDSAEAIGAAHLQENPITVPADLLAEMLIRSNHTATRHVWSEFDTEDENEEGDCLFNLGKPPTDQQLIEKIPDAVEADRAQGLLFSKDLYVVSVRKELRRHFNEELGPALTAALHAFWAELLPDSEFSNKDAPYFETVLDELQRRLTDHLTMPDYDTFWDAMKLAFKEKYLANVDRSLLPDNPYIQADESYLEDFTAYWTHDGRYEEVVSRVCAKVPPKKVKTMIKTEVKPRSVDTSDEVLQVQLGEMEIVRLVITDGDVNTEINYSECLVKGKEDAEYLQFYKAGHKPHNATTALFLIQKGAHDFRVEYTMLTEKDSQD